MGENKGYLLAARENSFAGDTRHGRWNDYGQLHVARIEQFHATAC
jgi:hypothetical protein